MKIEVIEKINSIIEHKYKNETVWSVLVSNRYNVFSRAIPKEDVSSNDWVKIMNTQINYLKEYISASIRFGLRIPHLNEEGSIVALAAYNAAIAVSDIEEGVFITPSSYVIHQEFYRLLMEMDI